MRTFIITLCAIFVLLTSVTVYEVMSVKKQDFYKDNIKKIEASIVKKDKETAERYIAETYEKWDESLNFLMAFTEHTELDRISEKLENLKSTMKFWDWEKMYI